MARAQNPNMLILELAVARLGPLTDEMVFLGGCATGLLLTDPAAPPIRVTQDVDVVTEAASLDDYQRLSKRLRARGFKEDQRSDAPVCRWVAEGLVLDVMPTNPAIPGFGNVWYQSAIDHAAIVQLSKGQQIRMVTAPCFLATKLAAFDGRGEGDYLMSHDIEDIVSVLDGRPETVGEVQAADEALRAHLGARFTALLSDSDFRAALPGHLPSDSVSQARVSLVLSRMTAISEFE